MPRSDIERRILKYLANNGSAAGTQITAWLRSVRRFQYTYADVESALFALRDEGLISCTNKVWWRR